MKPQETYNRYVIAAIIMNVALAFAIAVAAFSTCGGQP